MAFWTVALGLLIFWSALHVAASLRRHVNLKPVAKRDEGFLPTAKTSASVAAPPHWTSIGPCYVVWHTTSLNDWPVEIAASIDLRRLYRWGAFAVSLAQPVAVLGCMLLAGRQLAAILSRGNANGALQVVKRSLQARSLSTPEVKAVIPGLTIPLSEAPLMLLGLFAATTVHEAGHALAAGCSKIAPESVGAFIALAFPGAFVSLPAGPLDLLPAHSRLRIWTAGIWHNILLLMPLLVLSTKGLGLLQVLQGWTLYQDQSDLGVVVQSVRNDFSLRPFLPPGTIVTQLDDVDLHDSDERDHWTRYLSGKHVDRFASMGWCLGKDDLAAGSDASCCYTTSTLSDASQPICFSSRLGAHCLSPSAVFSISPSYPRCVDHCPGDNTLCIKPDGGSQLLRLTILPASVEDSATILYRGPKAALLRNVAVGSLQPRFAFVPAALPHLSERLLQHTLSATLALAAFNLLPIRKLDGEAILDCILELDVLPRLLAQLFKRSRRGIEMGCAAAAGVVVLGALVKAVV